MYIIKCKTISKYKKYIDTNNTRKLGVGLFGIYTIYNNFFLNYF